MISTDEIDELAALKQSAMDAAETFKNGVAHIAEKHGLNKGALTKYITARVSDKLAKLEEEQGDIERLLSGTGTDDQLNIFGGDNATA
jgi:hypothetical protein